MREVDLPFYRIGGREAAPGVRVCWTPNSLISNFRSGALSPRLMDEIWLRKTGFDVLTNVEILEKGFAEE